MWTYTRNAYSKVDTERYNTCRDRIEWAQKELCNALVGPSVRSSHSKVGAESYQTCAKIGLNGHKQFAIFTAKVAAVTSSTYYQVDAAV